MYPPRPARVGYAAAAALALTVACGGGLDTNDGVADPTPGTDVGCVVPSDCELAAASCCDCPSFALSVSEGFSASCEGSMCPPAEERCAALEAVCTGGVCAARCLPIPCGLSCGFGFAVDDFGCLLCECATAPAEPECSDDTDCTRVPADCCGCERGGRDTAVPVADVLDHQDGLGCPDRVGCPEVDTCDLNEIAVCLGGRCALASDGSGTDADAGPAPTPGLCGTPDLPPCPDGATCVLNAPDAEAASQTGHGTCAFQ